MPTPYTEGNGCAYLWKINSQYKCSCQGPETVECTCYSIADAVKCKHFKPESVDLEIYLQQQLKEILNNASFRVNDPIGNVELVEETDNGLKVTARLTKEGERIMKNDPVNHPSHYTAGGIECIDAIAAALSYHKDPVEAWLTGQIIKYIWRWPLKNGLEDLEKAKFYLERLMDHIIESEDSNGQNRND